MFLLPFQGHRESDHVIIAQSVGHANEDAGHLLKLRGQLKVIEIWKCICCHLVCKPARVADVGGHHVDAMLCSL